jgi:hypothetical protein
MSSYQTDPRVDDYINALPGWQQQICRQVRDIAHAADSELSETIKRKIQPYFVLQGNVVGLLAAKEWVTLLLYSPYIEDPHGIINGGHDNKSGRYISIREGESIDSEALTGIFRQIIAYNRAGRKMLQGRKGEE